MTTMITLEDGTSRLENGISRATRMLDGVPARELFTAEEYMNIYNCVYTMCIQPAPFSYSQELYEIFKKALKASIHSRILPALADKNGAPLLTELLCMWERYKAMAKCLGGLFVYLDRHAGRSYESLKDLSVCCFRDLVCNRFYQRFLDAAITMISQDRDEKFIDRNLLKNLSAFLDEIGKLGSICYYDHFEKAILENTASYCHHLASQWLLCYSAADYVHKANWYLNQEKERASQYFYYGYSVESLLQVVRWQLLHQTESTLIEKRKADGNHGSVMYQELLSGCAGLSLGDGSSMSQSPQ